VILYRISRLGYILQRRYRRVKYITLVNLLSAADPLDGDATTYDPERGETPEVLYPEYVTCTDKSRQVAAHAIRWLTDRAERSRLVARLEALKTEVAHGGAAHSAAQYILADLASRPQQIPAPHYTPASAPTAPPRKTRPRAKSAA
jgi:hypothetical protein